MNRVTPRDIKLIHEILKDRLPGLKLSGVVLGIQVMQGLRGDYALLSVSDGAKIARTSKYEVAKRIAAAGLQNKSTKIAQGGRTVMLYDAIEMLTAIGYAHLDIEEEESRKA